MQEDDEVVQVWYLMGWLHHLTHDQDSARFFLEQAEEVVTVVPRVLCIEEVHIIALESFVS